MDRLHLLPYQLEPTVQGTDLMCRVGKKALMPYANSEGPNEHAHPCSLIWTFSVRRRILHYPSIL